MEFKFAGEFPVNPKLDINKYPFPQHAQKYESALNRQGDPGGFS
jgi:hypothetical protein